MHATLVMTLIGDDRPGLVSALAQTVHAHGGNWLESSMTRLAGEFAGLLRVHVPVERVAELQQALSSLGQRGLTVVVHSGHEAPSAGGTLMSLEITAHDRPGIVSLIASEIAALKVNIEELQTGLRLEPHSGAPLFQARAALRLPDPGLREALRIALEKISRELTADFTLR